MHKLYRFIVILSILGLSIVANAAAPCWACYGGGGKDTARAMVVYNLNELELSPDGHSEGFLNLVDSVLAEGHLNEDMKHLIDVVGSIHKLKEDEIILLIDSLFSLEEIPYALINEINYRVSQEDFHNVADDNIYRIPKDTTGFPANYFYQTWNTTRTNPYGNALTAGDTTFTLLLADTQGELGKYTHPVDNIVTSRFGWRNGRNHNGFDLDLEVWDSVATAFSGKVRFAGWAGGFGRLVIVRHHNGLETYYAHLHRLKVAAGDLVDSGDVIGLGGSSGHSTGSHLHFEMRFKGVPLDPGQMIDFKAQALHNDTIVLKKTRWSYAVFPKGTQYHVVGKGDYLHRIASTYGISIDAICDLNGILRNDYLRLGQRIRVGQQ
jgi:murein DD-endopeptidase MepM/ murein hydrolase activator NlpD